MNNWTFGRKLAIGFGAMALLALVISLVAVVALRAAVSGQERVINVNAAILIQTERMNTNAAQMAANARGYMLSNEPRFEEQYRNYRDQFIHELSRMHASVYSDEGRRLVADAERQVAQYREQADQLMTLAASRPRIEVVVRQFDDKVVPARERVDQTLKAMVAMEERHLDEAKSEAAAIVNAATLGVSVLAVAGVIISTLLALLLTRTLGRQIGAAVGHVQSSSAELQAAASQQAAGARQQAGAMTEITTTISELVATSRQIAESAQRVAQIAEQTAQGARTGDGIVDRGQEAVAAIRRQIDQVVSHMLDLGRKSQEIGAVLDIVSELAEQTNILAINATIEATGAGESGKRFAVVAEEIRKLADRVAASTKSIRGQIDDVRGAVNTTVMATESGVKAVDAGARQFADVAAAFRQIGALVATTTEAAREIELSTKQQASAAEQVRIAVTDVAQATMETESSSAQTLQTASQLAGLSLDLRRLIQPQAVSA